MQSLSEVRVGESCTIKWMLGNVQIMDYLRSCDVKEGSQIRVLQQRSGGTIIRRNERRFVLGGGVAERIKV